MNARTFTSWRRLRLGAVSAAVVGAIALFGAMPTAEEAQMAEGYISGVVESSSGPEGGVWVIAETEELETRFVKIVVTADDGRFVLPQLPDATYDVWVRGYGLVDSEKVQLSPTNEDVTLEAVIAPNEQAAAEYYPGNYWYSLIKPPPASEFPGTGPDGNGIAENMRTQQHWLDVMKQGCQLCHQLGNTATRVVQQLDDFDSAVEAWDHRVQTGQRGTSMSAAMSRMGRGRALEMFADWTDRIAAGETPPRPPRPDGMEQNLVVTLWDWGTDSSFIHDEITTDKRNPTVNGGGPVYGVSAGHGSLTIVDPVENSAVELPIPVRPADPNSVPSRFPQEQLQPSYYWGDQLLWGRGGPDGNENSSDPHNPMMDQDGRVWMTSTIRARPNPDWCREGSDNKYAEYFPLNQSGRQASYYDPETEKFVLVDTCFGTHHLQFGEDANDTLWFSGDSNAIGWIDTKLYDETGDEQYSQGWCPTVIDTNGDGRITKPWNEPSRGGEVEIDPSLDTRIVGFGYGIIAHPSDDSIWITRTGPFPGRLVRLDRGDNPPETCIAEVYEPPSIENPNVDASQTGFAPRGIDVDRNGVIWTALSGSSQMASFDRTKCATLNGPDATGQQCAEGWTLYTVPGPQMEGVDTPGSADFHYYSWVDQYNTLGLGENVPIANGSSSDSLLALDPDSGEWTILRVPYPMAFYSRGLDGRIDDPNAGWKGRGLWANYGSNYIWHTEGGKGTKSKMVHFQLRPDPLAR
ncbi:MAG: carboxypeptidase regulatory-like domain-containing protein [Acidobacteria bacterium]|nr:carboxypeptidase regulatory-like domain-containing protein [Acidobacteriota bacterium]MYD72259.1 carboxypeptidase regulatory-like domain-containing protein [Acidobacteriota bacterium]MYJ04106.1 carboxypeptidase regulatory-like domain-containing protein [Acidobacteriota bacterium]